MNTHKRLLREMVNLPTINTVKFTDLDNAFSSKLFIRYHTALRLKKIIDDELPALADTVLLKINSLLAGAPIKYRGSEYNPTELVKVCFAGAIKEYKQHNDFIIDVVRMYKASELISYAMLDDVQSLEFINTLPKDGEAALRTLYLSNDLRIYFIGEKYMLLVNLGYPDKDLNEDQNYFIAIIELGSLITSFLEGVDPMMTKINPLKVGKLKPIHYTTTPRYVNRYMVLWEEVKEPIQHYWFVKGRNTKRHNLAYEYNFVQPSPNAQYTLSNEDWCDMKRIFGISDLENLK